jgi:ankyrin repeat protein
MPDDAVLRRISAMRPLPTICVALAILGCEAGGPPEAARETVHALAERGETAPLLAEIEDRGNVDERDVCYRTPLMFAAQFGRLDTVRQLLASGARVNLHEKGYYSALMLAAGNGHTAVVEVLAEAGAALDDAELTRGWTALIWAAQRGHRDTVEALLALGADASARDEQGRSARDRALEQGHPEIASLL